MTSKSIKFKFKKPAELSKAEWEDCEFDSDGVWNWVHPFGRPPPSPRPHPYRNTSHYMTAKEYMRAENNRLDALEKLAEAYQSEYEMSKNE